jgi:hypothetical protein
MMKIDILSDPSLNIKECINEVLQTSKAGAQEDRISNTIFLYHSDSNFSTDESVKHFDETTLTCSPNTLSSSFIVSETKSVSTLQNNLSTLSSFSEPSFWSLEVKQMYDNARSNKTVVVLLKLYHKISLDPPIYKNIKNFIKKLLSDENVIYKLEKEKIFIIKTVLSIIIALNSENLPNTRDLYSIVSSFLIDSMIENSLKSRKKCCGCM